MVNLPLGDVEQVRHHRFDRFGRVAMIPPASAKAVAQFGEVNSRINVHDSNLPDDDLVQPHCPIEGGGVVVAAYPTGQQQPGRVDVGMRRPGHKPGGLGVTSPVVVHLLGMVNRPSAEHQPIGPDRTRANQFHDGDNSTGSQGPLQMHRQLHNRFPVEIWA